MPASRRASRWWERAGAQLDSLLSRGEGRRESFSRSKIIKRGFKALEVVLAVGGWRIDSVDSVVDGGR